MLIESRPILKYFLYLFIKPANAIAQIVQEKPSFMRIAGFLFCVSFLRGIVEGVWMLLREGQFNQVISSPILLNSYLRLGIPFIFTSITCGYVRWVGFAFLPCFLASVFGKRSHYKDYLRVCGIVMGIYLVTIIPNFAYLFFRLPMIQFNISSFYNPAIGIGQVITGIWFVYIMYIATRVICNLNKYQSLLAALSVLLINLGALIFGSLVFFNIPQFAAFSMRAVLNIATFVFIIITVLGIPIFLWLGKGLSEDRGFR